MDRRILLLTAVPDADEDTRATPAARHLHALAARLGAVGEVTRGTLSAEGQGARGAGLQASGFGLQVSDQARSTSTPKPEAWSLKPEGAPQSAPAPDVVVVDGWRLMGRRPAGDTPVLLDLAADLLPESCTDDDPRADVPAFLRALDEADAFLVRPDQREALGVWLLLLGVAPDDAARVLIEWHDDDAVPAGDDRGAGVSPAAGAAVPAPDDRGAGVSPAAGAAVPAGETPAPQTEASPAPTLEAWLALPLLRARPGEGLARMFADRSELLDLNARLLREKRDLTLRIRGTEERAADAEVNLHRQRDATLAAREELLGVKETLHEERTERQRLEGERDRLDAARRELAAERERLLADFREMDEQIRRELDQLEADIGRKEAAVARLEEVLAVREREARSLEQVLAQKEEELARLGRAHAELSHEFALAQGIIRSFKNRRLFRWGTRMQRAFRRFLVLRPRLWRLALANVVEQRRGARWHRRRSADARPPTPAPDEAPGAAPRVALGARGGPDTPPLPSALPTGCDVLVVALPFGDPEAPPFEAAALTAALARAGWRVACADLNRRAWLQADDEARHAWSGAAADRAGLAPARFLPAALIDRLVAARPELLLFSAPPAGAELLLSTLERLAGGDPPQRCTVASEAARDPAFAARAAALGAVLVIAAADPREQAAALTAFRAGTALPDCAWAPAFQGEVPSSEFRVPSSLTSDHDLAPRTTHLAPSDLSTQHSALSTQHSALRTPHSALRTPYSAPPPPPAAPWPAPLDAGLSWEAPEYGPGRRFFCAGIATPPGALRAGWGPVSTFFPRAPEDAAEELAARWAAAPGAELVFVDWALNADAAAFDRFLARLERDGTRLPFACRLCSFEDDAAARLSRLWARGCRRVEFVVNPVPGAVLSPWRPVTEAERAAQVRAALALGLAASERAIALLPCAIPAGLDALLVMTPAWGVDHPSLALGYLQAAAARAGFRTHALDVNRLMWRLAAPALRDEWANDAHNRWKHDGQVETLLESFRPWLDRVIAAVRDAAPRVVGFSCNTANVLSALGLARRLRAALPEVFLVFGGPQCLHLKEPEDLFTGTTIERHRPPPGVLDAIVPGEGEQAFVALLENLAAGGDGRASGVLRFADGALTAGPPPPERATLSELPRPLLDFTLYDEPRLPVMMSRGCPFDCAFCTDRTRWGRFRASEPETVYEEIAAGVARFGARQLVFLDSLVNAHVAKLDRLCDLLLERGPAIEWSGNAVIRRQMTAEFCAKLRRAGCRALAFGTESFSDPVLKLMHKHQSVDEITRVLGHARAAGISLTANLIVGYPGETEEDFEATVAWLRAHHRLIDMIGLLSDCQVLRDTPLGREPEKWGVIYRSATGWETADGANTHAVRRRRMARLCTELKALGVPVDFENYSMRDFAAPLESAVSA